MLAGAATMEPVLSTGYHLQRLGPNQSAATPSGSRPHGQYPVTEIFVWAFAPGFLGCRKLNWKLEAIQLEKSKTQMFGFDVFFFSPNLVYKSTIQNLEAKLVPPPYGQIATAMAWIRLLAVALLAGSESVVEPSEDDLVENLFLIQARARSGSFLENPRASMLDPKSQVPAPFAYDTSLHSMHWLCF